jgi:TPR repeat protein
MATRTKSRAELNDELFAQANREWDAGDEKVAFKLFLQAAAAGHASAKNSVGYFLDHGLGTRQNAAKAMTWYRKAARQGDLSAYSNIAINYRDEGNAKAAKVWFSKALDKGDASAALELAKLLLKTNRKSDSAKAKQYLRMATKSRHISDEDKNAASRLLHDLISG